LVTGSGARVKYEQYRFDIGGTDEHGHYQE
jgi:hypothetical protein